MAHYVKLWSNITSSSILEEDVPTRWLWICMLVLADQEGVVYGTVPALARAANLSVSDAEHALECLQAPDPLSTTPEDEGRRIRDLGGNHWLIVNAAKYRGLKDPEQQRAQVRERVRRHRAGAPSNAGNADCNAGNADVTPSSCSCSCSTPPTPSPGNDADPTAPPRRFTPPSVEQVAAFLVEISERRFSAAEFVAAYEARGWTVGRKGTPMRSWRGAVQQWVALRDREGQPQPPAATTPPPDSLEAVQALLRARAGAPRGEV